MASSWRFRVSAAPATLSSALETWSHDRKSGLSGRSGTGVVWWLSVSPSDFMVRYERLRFFVEIRGRIIEVEPGQSEVRISVRLEPLAWLLVTALAILLITVGLRPSTPLKVSASLGALLLLGVVGGAAWIGAHQFVNSKLIPRLLTLPGGGGPKVVQQDAMGSRALVD